MKLIKLFLSLFKKKEVPKIELPKELPPKFPDEELIKQPVEVIKPIPKEKAKHSNNGQCLKCAQIFNKYPGFNEQLEDWFWDFQSKCPDFHISCAGRGRDDQEREVREGSSKAHWGRSAHNYNVAIDLWINDNGKYSLSKSKFEKDLKPNLKPWLKWYGEPGSSFYELPHLELRDWREMRDEGSIILVE